jgi:hypothetical protein
MSAYLSLMMAHEPSKSPTLVRKLAEWATADLATCAELFARNNAEATKLWLLLSKASKSGHISTAHLEELAALARDMSEELRTGKIIR